MVNFSVMQHWRTVRGAIIYFIAPEDQLHRKRKLRRRVETPTICRLQSRTELIRAYDVMY